MGMGDVKLALLLGAMLGRTVPLAMMIAMITALVPATVLLVRHGAAARKMAIPFGPFLALGGLVALFAGDWLGDAYLGLFSGGDHCGEPRDLPRTAPREAAGGRRQRRRGAHRSRDAGA